MERLNRMCGWIGGFEANDPEERVLRIWTAETLPDWNDGSLTYNHFVEKLRNVRGDGFLFANSLDDGNLQRFLLGTAVSGTNLSFRDAKAGLDFFLWLNSTGDLFAYSPQNTPSHALRSPVASAWCALQPTEQQELAQRYLAATHGF